MMFSQGWMIEANRVAQDQVTVWMRTVLRQVAVLALGQCLRQQKQRQLSSRKREEDDSVNTLDQPEEGVDLPCHQEQQENASQETWSLTSEDLQAVQRACQQVAECWAQHLRQQAHEQAAQWLDQLVQNEGPLLYYTSGAAAGHHDPSSSYFSSVSTSNAAAAAVGTFEHTVTPRSPRIPPTGDETTTSTLKAVGNDDDDAFLTGWARIRSLHRKKARTALHNTMGTAHPVHNTPANHPAGAAPARDHLLPPQTVEHSAAPPMNLAARDDQVYSNEEFTDHELIMILDHWGRSGRTDGTWNYHDGFDDLHHRGSTWQRILETYAQDDLVRRLYKRSSMDSTTTTPTLQHQLQLIPKSLLTKSGRKRSPTPPDDESDTNPVDRPNNSETSDLLPGVSNMLSEEAMQLVVQRKRKSYHRSLAATSSTQSSWSSMAKPDPKKGNRRLTANSRSPSNLSKATWSWTEDIKGSFTKEQESKLFLQYLHGVDRDDGNGEYDESDKAHGRSDSDQMSADASGPPPDREDPSLPAAVLLGALRDVGRFHAWLQQSSVANTAQKGREVPHQQEFESRERTRWHEEQDSVSKATEKQQRRKQRQAVKARLGDHILAPRDDVRPGERPPSRILRTVATLSPDPAKANEATGIAVTSEDQTMEEAGRDTDDSKHRKVDQQPDLDDDFCEHWLDFDMGNCIFDWVESDKVHQPDSGVATSRPRWRRYLLALDSVEVMLLDEDP